MKFLKAEHNKNGIIQAIEKATIIAREYGEAITVCNMGQNCTDQCEGCCSIPAEIELVCFDMDATIIKTESINEIFKNTGLQNNSKMAVYAFEELTESAMSGKADFTANFKERVALLKGIEVTQIRKTAYALPLANGIDKLIKTLKDRGIKTALITGNFDIIGRVMQQRLGFDFVYTSVPEVKEGKLTGKLHDPIIDADAKSDILCKICRSNNISLCKTIVVGDGANDIKMMAKSAIAVAYNAPIAKESMADAILSLIK